ncbi:MAG: UDP-N-acetyl-D-mannosamine dehydrogenase [Corynebacterium sp.]|uniref:UDP-N-acetyl-D-mannosamine dehydrogenase n=1 Tax=unclassified Corynebacterium TaxID=2624378 RepID=UPI000A45651C|nr:MULTISPECIES: UDP-N-acetyl-D-mannosamine dehydrogenase [unclassified Corynebacterium]MDU1461397.1 UDP-N-acetyl-D-mannosamine dehydrogenase [Corynebacterium sp.]MDU7102826.1 UDP-N-acetyl-D-mannosamine dehydrogenase [Corynebacterium sp.]
MSQRTVAFVGLGYIGLPTAVVMANAGSKVIGIDVNAENVKRINRGEVTFVEPSLQEELGKALNSGRFFATTQQVHADTYIVAVPTPFTESYDVDMTFIYAAAEDIAPQLTGDELVILESTSPPQSTAKMAERILELRPDLAADGTENREGKPVVYFAHCPERILPGNAIAELKTNDRIIGGQTPEATRRAAELYATFCSGELLPTNAVTAEMAKLTENSFRDVNIAFANELSLICDNLGINVWELIDLANHHPRVNILQPGPGVGGHCIAVDPWFIVAADPFNAKLIHAARKVNDNKPAWVINKVKQAVKNTNASTIAVLGLAFKANVDDLRQSPALNIAVDLAEELPDISLLAVEPNITELPKRLKGFDNITLTNCDDALRIAEVLVLLVDHNEFKEISKVDIADKTVIDTKGLWN